MFKILKKWFHNKKYIRGDCGQRVIRIYPGAMIIWCRVNIFIPIGIIFALPMIRN